MGRAEEAPRIRVAVACTPAAGVAVEVEIEVDFAATVTDAIRASGLLERYPGLVVTARTVGLWGRACALDAGLRDGDRVEIHRPLARDPNEARRLRARQLRDKSRS